MLRRLRTDEQGFSLIELLVVILIIGVLAAIAIPSFLNQRGKANDTQAKVIARTAQTAMETYSTNNSGSYANATAGSLAAIEPSLITSSTTNAFLTSVVDTSNSYTVAAYSPNTSDTFTVTRDPSGNITRTCGGTGSGCTGGTW
jgi:type IV pilus assembly protein PilA